MTKIQKRRIRKWVDALRSGEFRQGKLGLRIENAYCCLGVACEIYRRTTRKGKWENGAFVVADDDWDSMVMPRTVADWFGTNKNPEVDRPHTRGSVAGFNDGGADFPTIANAIEREFLTEE